ncbi:MAG: hypothetical protein WAV18_05710 [Roseiarcus sp.]
MHEAALVRLAKCGDDADGEAEEASRVHRCADQSLERFAAGVFEHKHGPTAVLQELQRLRRPRSIEFIP